ncbi:hypothetical protein OPV22_005213 [Ensete ventricosum]|uniref:Uncharacterized protein n=1 Tax=Ensete ventricosum TaxID=4639 RepID=A0AAV8Q0N7_ENSVE|nr:hypothetical protein OPV22_005213 [Ensete ventricosum]
MAGGGCGAGAGVHKPDAGCRRSSRWKWETPGRSCRLGAHALRTSSPPALVVSGAGGGGTVEDEDDDDPICCCCCCRIMELGAGRNFDSLASRSSASSRALSQWAMWLRLATLLRCPSPELRVSLLALWVQGSMPILASRFFRWVFQ